MHATVGSLSRTSGLRGTDDNSLNLQGSRNSAIYQLLKAEVLADVRRAASDNDTAATIEAGDRLKGVSNAVKALPNTCALAGLSKSS